MYTISLQYSLSTLSLAVSLPLFPYVIIPSVLLYSLISSRSPVFLLRSKHVYGIWRVFKLTAVSLLLLPLPPFVLSVMHFTTDFIHALCSFIRDLSGKSTTKPERMRSALPSHDTLPRMLDALRQSKSWRTNKTRILRLKEIMQILSFHCSLIFCLYKLSNCLAFLGLGTSSWVILTLLWA